MREYSIPPPVLARLRDAEAEQMPVVVMTCGIAGSGKSTLAKAIVAAFPSFNRVSTDQILYEKYGLCGADYPEDKYAEYQVEANLTYMVVYKRLLQDRKNIVLDRSFYDKGDRDEFRAMAEAAGAKAVLVYFKASREVLWRRICERRANGINADSALDIKEDLLDAYVAGFDVPEGEDEIVINVE